MALGPFFPSLSKSKKPMANHPDPLLETEFFKELIKQLRAQDSLGRHDSAPAQALLEPFILSPERKQVIPLTAALDSATQSRIEAFYNALCALIERECGRIAVPMMNLSAEGFGRVIITVGKLVVLDKTLRDAHRFGFASLSVMKDEADKILSVALNIIGKHSDVAGM